MFRHNFISLEMTNMKNILTLFILIQLSIAEDGLIKVLDYEKGKFTKSQISFSSLKTEFGKVSLVLMIILHREKF